MQLSDILRLPEKTWTPKNNGVQTVIKAVGQTNTKAFNNPDGSQTLQYRQPVTITDLTGRTEKIMHQTNYPESLLAGASVNQAATWRLKWYRDGRGTTHVVGYTTEMTPNVGGAAEPWQLPQNVPQTAPETPPQSAQGANVPYNALHSQEPYPQTPREMQMPDTYAYPLTPASQARITASVACQCAARIMGVAPKKMPANEAASILIEIAIPIKEWILNNKIPQSIVEAPLDDSPQASDEKVPWENEQ